MPFDIHSPSRPGRRSTGAAAVAVCLALTLAACGGGGGDASTAKGDAPIVRIGFVGAEALSSLNPFVGYFSPDYTVFQLMYPALVQFDGVKARPDLATSWTQNADSTRWTFKLRPAKWSDGKPVTAQDAAFTFNTIVKYASGSAATLAVFTRGVKSARAVDPGTLELRFAQPVAVDAFLGNVVSVPILPQHVWGPLATGNGAKLKAKRNDGSDGPVVVAGPFKPRRFDPKGTSIFTRNDATYAAKPRVKGFGLQAVSNPDAAIAALKSGRLDIVYGAPTAAAKSIRADSKLRVTGIGDLVFQQLQVSDAKEYTKHPELKRPQVRRAFNLAIDRDQIVSEAFSGFAKPAGSSIPPGYARYVTTVPKPIAQDTAQANRILDGLGLERGAGGVRVADGKPMAYELQISSGNRAAYGREVDVLTRQFKAIGVTLRARINDNLKPDYANNEMSLGTNSPSPDPDFTLQNNLCSTKGFYNPQGFCDKAYDALYAQQTSEPDAAKRRALIDRMLALLQKDQVEVPLVYPQQVVAWNAAWTGVEAAGSPVGFFHYFNKTQLNSLVKR